MENTMSSVRLKTTITQKGQKTRLIIHTGGKAVSPELRAKLKPYNPIYKENAVYAVGDTWHMLCLGALASEEFLN